MQPLSNAIDCRVPPAGCGNRAGGLLSVDSEICTCTIILQMLEQAKSPSSQCHPGRENHGTRSKDLMCVCAMCHEERRLGQSINRFEGGRSTGLSCARKTRNSTSSSNPMAFSVSLTGRRPWHPRTFHFLDSSPLVSGVLIASADRKSQDLTSIMPSTLVGNSCLCSSRCAPGKRQG